MRLVSSSLLVKKYTSLSRLKPSASIELVLILLGYGTASSGMDDNNDNNDNDDASKRDI